jgi:hypothetical protein
VHPEAGEGVGGEASPDLQAEGEAGILEVREEEGEDEKDDRATFESRLRRSP